MKQTVLSYEELEQRIADWAKEQEGIRAVIVVGSRARRDSTVDRWSDLDTIIFLAQASPYLANAEWLNQFADVILPVLDATEPGHPEWLVLFEGGLKADFVLHEVEDEAAGLETMMADSSYQGLFARGVRVLFDSRDAEAAGRWLRGPGELHTPPSADAFNVLVGQMLLGVYQTSKLLARGDLWRAKRRCECELKTYLLTMLQWHTKNMQGAQQDTWYDGRFISEWAVQWALDALPDTFGGYDRPSWWQALVTTLELFRRLAIETAERLGYAYPYETDGRIAAWAQDLR